MARIVDVFRFLRNGSNLADMLNDLDITPGRLQTIIHSARFKKLIALQEEIAQIGIRLTATTCAMRAAGLLELIAMNQYHKGNRQACVDLLRQVKATEHLAPEIEKDVDQLISESVDRERYDEGNRQEATGNGEEAAGNRQEATGNGREEETKTEAETSPSGEPVLMSDDLSRDRHSAIRDPQSSDCMLPQTTTTRKHGTLRALATNIARVTSFS